MKSASDRTKIMRATAVVAMMVTGLVLVGCTPSLDNLENRSTASLYNARTGSSLAESAVKCSAGTSTTTNTTDSTYHDPLTITTWKGTCTINGATYAVTSRYYDGTKDVGAGPHESQWAYVDVTDGRPSPNFAGHYSFDKWSDGAWHFVTKSCQGGGC